MAINDDNLERDPRLARLVQASADEEPPAALDAAILAAARREVGARPQVVGGGGEASSPPARTKRNWYVPVSIAAVVVLSVSLVTLVHEEKGDELAQPPRSASTPPKVSVPPPAVQAPAAASPEPQKADAMLRDTAPAEPKVAEEKPAKAVATPEAYGELAKKQRTQPEKMESATDKALGAHGTARKDQVAGSFTREQGLASETAPAPQAAPAAQARQEMQASGDRDRLAAESRREPEASGRLAQERTRNTIGIRGFDGPAGGVASGAPAGAATPAPSSPPEDLKASPDPFPAQASRDAAEARARSEADRNAARGTIQEVPRTPMATTAPPAPVVAAPRRAAPSTEDALAQSAPSPAENRVLPVPPPPPGSAKLATPQASKPVARAMEKRPPLWHGLENQPPEKWLERLAEFKRDGRKADADELLAEFRRRFPDHPTSAR